MRFSGGCQHAWLLAFFPIVLFLVIMATPLRAEEALVKEPLAEEPRREPIPPGPREYPADWRGFTERLSLIAYLDVYYSLSHPEGSEDFDGGGINGLLSPAYKIKDGAFLILTYDGTYYKRLDFYSDQVGPRKRTEYQRHTVTPMLRIDFGERSRYSITPSFFFTRTYNKDVEGGSWDEGLYNYRDQGGGLDFRMRELGFRGAAGALKLGLQYYRREYPNFVSLLDLATGLGVERDERDYHGVLARAGYSWTNNVGFSWGADYYVLYKDLDDKKVVDRTGVLTSDEQRDNNHNLDLSFWYVPHALRGLRIGLDLNGNLYDSNQNYYDGLGTITLADDVYIDNFYDYTAYRIRPNISYTFRLLPLTTSLAYSYQRLQHSDRKAQKTDQTYKDDEQWEAEHIVDFILRYELNQRLSLYGRYQYLNAHSNNDNEAVYEYDHAVHYFYGGVSIRY